MHFNPSQLVYYYFSHFKITPCTKFHFDTLEGYGQKLKLKLAEYFNVLNPESSTVPYLFLNKTPCIPRS